MWRSSNSIEKRWVKSKMHNPKISIITVSYNAAKTIEQTILSVVNQTYSNIEYIIIDGGSVDGTIDIIKKYQGKIAYWVSEPDNGIYDAMNKGIDVAMGKYIYFLGADDCLADKSTIEFITTNYLSNMGNIDILAGKIWRVDREFNIMKLSSTIDLKDIYLGVPHQGMFTNASLLKKQKFDIKYKVAADYNFLLKCYFNKNIKFYCVNTPIATYSINGESSKMFKMCVNEFEMIINKYAFSEDMKKNFYVANKIRNAFIKNIIKTVLKRIYLWKYFRLYRGWEIFNGEE